MERLVDVDNVLDLFGCSDRDIYGKYTIEDALYDGSLKTIEIIRCKYCAHLQKNGQCDKTHLWIGNKEDSGSDDFFCGFGERKIE